MQADMARPSGAPIVLIRRVALRPSRLDIRLATSMPLVEFELLTESQRTDS